MKLRNRIAVIAASAIMIMGTLPQAVLPVYAEETQQAAMTATRNVNVRAADSASSAKLGTLTKGQTVTTTGKTAKGWYSIDYNGQTGYVSGKYLAGNTNSPEATPTADTKATQAPAPAPAVQNGTTKTFSNGVTFVARGTTPNGRTIWYIQGDDGSWPDYMIAAYDATGVTSDMSDYDKAVAINNYICKTVDYAYENGVDDRAGYCACLSYGKAICIGYAHAFDCLCTMSGIYSNQVGGLAGGATHSWNYVLIGDTKYWVDCTWNDGSNNAYLMSTTLWADHEVNYEK